MEQMKKRKIRRIAFPICAALLALLLAALPFLIESRRDSDTEVNFLSGRVDRGDISETVSGTGTLTEQEAVEVELPARVKITEFLVSNGDTVAEGQALASVDRTTVMEAVSSVQETLDYLSEKMEDAYDESGASRITAPAAGRVTAVYVQEGDLAEDAMLEHSGLIELSLDGLLAAEIRSDIRLGAGAAVTVRLADGTEIPGQVEHDLDGTLTVTVSDDGPASGQEITAFAADGTELGGGTLRPHMAWTAEAIAGTVSSVPVKEGDKVYAGQTLLRLSDTEYSAEYTRLAAQRREYEDLMLELFLLYQNKAVTAPCAGIVSGVDEDSAALLAAGDGGYHITLLANNTPIESEAGYKNRVGMVKEIYSDGSYALLLQPGQTEIPVEGNYADFLPADISADSMTETGSVQPGTEPLIFTYRGGSWTRYEEKIALGDVLLFTYNDTDNTLAWMVYLGRNEISSEPQTPQQPQTQGGGQIQLPTANFGAMGGGFFSGGGTAQEEEFELFDLGGTALMSVTPQEEVTVTLSIDELDILSLTEGQTAEVTLDALPGQSFEGTVTGIDSAGLSSGGNSKYAVEITLPRTGNMLGGMNATVTVTVSVREDVLRVPAEALAESSAGTLLYRSFDETAGELTDPVDVETGLSDGAYVELLSGLEEGDAFWYVSYGKEAEDFPAAPDRF